MFPFVSAFVLANLKLFYPFTLCERIIKEWGENLSDVFTRLRGRTGTQFEITALELQTEITKYCVNEKYVPKKWRLLIGVPLINKIDELVDNISFANSIYPTDEKELQERKRFQVRAIANCYQLQNLIIKLENTVDKVTIKSLDKIIDLLCIERNLLLAWKKSNKIKV